MNAQEIFEKLGYERHRFIDILYVKTKKKTRHTVVFFSEEKKFKCYVNERYACSIGVSEKVSIKLHQAITQQMKELGWL